MRTARALATAGHSGTPIAKIATFTDAFSGTSLDTTKWTQTTGGSATMSYSSSGAVVNFPSSSTAATIGQLVSVAKYDLIASSAYLQVSSVPSNSTSADAICSIYLDTTHFVRFIKQSGNLFFQYNNGGSTSTLGSPAYNSTNHKYWRIRESGGTTFWDTSSDGSTWTNQVSHANPFTLTSLSVSMTGSCFQNESNPGTFTFKTFNT